MNASMLRDILNTNSSLGTQGTAGANATDHYWDGKKRCFYKTQASVFQPIHSTIAQSCQHATVI